VAAEAAAPSEAPAPTAAGTKPQSARAAEAAGGEGPSIPAADQAFNDDGKYPNLAQVPSRPVNMPTFTEAATLEKTLVADAGTAKQASPASPQTPAVDSAAPAPAAPAPQAAPKSAPVASSPVIASRAEDAQPCLSAESAASPAATLHFDPGSAALRTGDLEILAEAMPTVREAKGTIRILGHGDTDAKAAHGAARFELAASRAGAVAQAVAGFGVPASRIAVGVACGDAALGGASVQLYAES
jgi:outer membrane protein OmpA-like peptidoglycan-associated protein